MTGITIFNFSPEIKLSDILGVFRRKKFDQTNSHVLFIDDDDFPVVDNLKKSGWMVEKVNDVTNIDDIQVRRANVIFIDYKGVGRIFSESEEGIALAKLIKKTYGTKKRVVLYSGHMVTLGEYLNIIDNQLPKNSNTYEFELMIRAELEKLK